MFLPNSVGVVLGVLSNFVILLFRKRELIAIL